MWYKSVSAGMLTTRTNFTFQQSNDPKCASKEKNGFTPRLKVESFLRFPLSLKITNLISDHHPLTIPNWITLWVMISKTWMPFLLSLLGGHWPNQLYSSAISLKLSLAVFPYTLTSAHRSGWLCPVYSAGASRDWCYQNELNREKMCLTS